MDNKQLALEIAKAIDDKKGLDIQVIDVESLCSFADYFVIAHGGSERQVKGLAENVEDALEKHHVFKKNKEGKENSGWILLDYGDVIVHLFSEEKRRHFNIENLWSDGQFIAFDEA